MPSPSFYLVIGQQSGGLRDSVNGLARLTYRHLDSGLSDIRPRNCYQRDKQAHRLHVHPKTKRFGSLLVPLRGLVGVSSLALFAMGV
jgi:hypothetical protein